MKANRYEVSFVGVREQNILKNQIAVMIAQLYEYTENVELYTLNE